MEVSTLFYICTYCVLTLWCRPWWNFDFKNATFVCSDGNYAVIGKLVIVHKLWEDYDLEVECTKGQSFLMVEEIASGHYCAFIYPLQTQHNLRSKYCLNFECSSESFWFLVCFILFAVIEVCFQVDYILHFVDRALKMDLWSLKTFVSNETSNIWRIISKEVHLVQSTLRPRVNVV